MQEVPKICCIGSNLESYECLQFLISKKCKIHTLITLPAGNNKHVSDYYDLHDFCEKNNIHVIDTINVNSNETLEIIREQQLDYLFTLGWSQIFREDFISCFTQFIVGTHPTKLPYGRGRAPLPWTILEGLKESAVSFFKIDTGVDTGKIIFQREFLIPDGCYVSELYNIVAAELAQGFYELYMAISNKEVIYAKTQSEEGISIRGKRVPSDGLLEFHMSANDAERLVRAVSKPYPGAYCYYKDSKICFWKAEMPTNNVYKGTLGQILKKGNDEILVQFSDGTLWLKNPTDEAGNPIEMRFFKLGDKLGYNVQDEIYNLKKHLKK